MKPTPPSPLQAAIQLHQRGELAAAKARYQALLARNPEWPEPLHLLGVLHHQQGERLIASQLLQRAIALQPDNPVFHYDLGVVLKGLGQLAAAVEAYRTATRLRPEYVNAWVNLGNTLGQAGEWQAAVTAYRQAVEHRPTELAHRKLLARALANSREFAAAATEYATILEREPAVALNHNNLGWALQSMGETTPARACYLAALQRDPDCTDARVNLGIIHESAGEYQAALAAFDRVLELHPEHPQATYYRSFIQLRNGELLPGWRGYEARFACGNHGVTGMTQPRWRGEPLSGQRVLLIAEQGLGDAIQFLRYAPLVAARGGAPLLGVPPALEPLTSGVCGGKFLVVPNRPPYPPHHLHCPLLSLPGVFATELANLPATTPYLVPPPQLTESWKQRLGPASRFRIGVVWAGNPKHTNDRNRSLPLATLLAALPDPQVVELVSLQKGEATAQLASSPVRITDYSPLLGDLAESAALMLNLDLVITVDSAPAHLAGALGVPVWVLLPFVPDWRWLLARGDSPWYPTMRLFRQPAPGDWTTVVAQVRKALAGLIVF